MPKKGLKNFQYLPTAGVRTDLKRLMNTFLACNTVRYEHFCQVWRERKMSYLCAGRSTDREAREFVERALLITQEYFLPPYQFQVRVGGLYLLYAIYQIQPLNPKVKIRMTPTQWQETVNFQQQAAQQNHLDVVYVFQRLLQEQAFLFCYTSMEMNIYACMKELEDREEDLADNLREEKSALNSLFNYESLEKLSYLQDQYLQRKISLAGPDAVKPDKSLDVVQAELVEDIVVLLQGFKETVASISRQGKRSEDSDQRSEPTAETTGNRRQKLKTQAYMQIPGQTNKHHSVVPSPVPLTKTTAHGVAAVGDILQKSMISATREKLGVSKAAALTNDDGDEDRSDENDEDYNPTPPKSWKSRKAEERRHGSQGMLAMKAEASSDVRSKDRSHTTPVLDHSDHTLSAGQASGRGQQLKSRSPPGTLSALEGRESQIRASAIIRESPASPSLSYRTKSTNEIMVYPKNPVVDSGKENPSRASVGRKKCDDGNIPLMNKIAFKWKRPEKKGQTVKSCDTGGDDSQTAESEAVQPPRKRGRPRKYDPNAEPIEVRVYPKSMPSQTIPDNTKYEMVLFPTGTANVLYGAKVQEPGRRAATGYIPQAVQPATAKNCLQGHISDTNMIMSALENFANAKGNKSRVCRETVLEVVVAKEVGKPAVIQSVKTQNMDPPEAPSGSENVSEVKHGSKVEEASTLQSGKVANVMKAVSKSTKVVKAVSGSTKVVKAVSESTKVVKAVSESTKVVKAVSESTKDAILRLKARCKRNLEETDEPIGKFLKKCQIQDSRQKYPYTESQEQELAYLGPSDLDKWALVTSQSEDGVGPLNHNNCAERKVSSGQAYSRSQVQDTPDCNNQIFSKAPSKEKSQVSDGIPSKEKSQVSDGIPSKVIRLEKTYPQKFQTSVTDRTKTNLAPWQSKYSEIPPVSDPSQASTVMSIKSSAVRSVAADVNNKSVDGSVIDHKQFRFI